MTSPIETGTHNLALSDESNVPETIIGEQTGSNVLGGLAVRESQEDEILHRHRTKESLRVINPDIITI